MKYLILISMLSNGMIEYQPMDPKQCTKIVASVKSGHPVVGEKSDNEIVLIIQAHCFVPLEDAMPSTTSCNSNGPVC